jgi:hypothetical protein
MKGNQQEQYIQRGKRKKKKKGSFFNILNEQYDVELITNVFYILLCVIGSHKYICCYNEKLRFEVLHCK